MTPNQIDPEKEAETLDAFLRGELPDGASGLPEEEAALAIQLKAAARQVHADPAFRSDLEIRLVGTQKASPSAKISKTSRHLSYASWVGLTILLLLGLGWAIENLLPRQSLIAAQPSMTAAPASFLTATTGVESPFQATSNPMAAPTPTPYLGETAVPPPLATPSSLSFTYRNYPGLEFIFQASFPPSPSEASVFELLPEEKLTIENASSAAAQLGVSGSVYKTTGEDPQATYYVVSDGVGRVIFLNSPQDFIFDADYASILSRNGNYPSPEEQVRLAEEFLKSHGLLSFPYQAEADAFQPGLVHFFPLQTELPVRFSLPYVGPISVQVSPQGQVLVVDYTLLAFQKIGVFPIENAEEAWKKFLNTNTQIGAEFNSASFLPNPQTWQRTYPTGQRVELFGFLETLPAVEPGVQPLVTFNNFLVEGNLQALVAAVKPGQFTHVWGQFQTGKKGQPVFHIEGWQPSAFSDQNLEGIIQRQGNLAYFQTSDSRLLLPDLPADMPEGKASVRGVIFNQPEPTLSWWIITVGAMGGGGGGGGGLSFAELNLAGASGLENPTPAPAISDGASPTPPGPTEAPATQAQTGQRLDGARGIPSVTIYQSADGSQKTVVSLWLDATPEFPQGLDIHLEGPGLSGIEAYHVLPIKVWGQFSDTSGPVPILNVERFEPVYPGLAAQAWLGAYQVVTLEGKPVLLFLAQEGARYVLSSSINAGPDSGAGRPGDALIIEGVVYPDEKFGGYPVIHETSASMANGRTDLNGYQPHNINPPVIQENAPGSNAGKATIEKIELVYYTAYLRNGGPNGASTVYVQPVWRFSGHYGNGDAFEILVQALTDQYLKIGIPGG